MYRFQDDKPKNNNINIILKYLIKLLLLLIINLFVLFKFGFMIFK